jgi:serine O-acetyltransferase
MFGRLREDIQNILSQDPAARSGLEIVLCYPGFHAVRWHRRANWLHRHHLKLLARMISSLNRFFTGVDIHPGAKIGRRLFIDHAAAVVIGETAEIGDDCILYQGCTLGGTGKDTGKRHPTLLDHVMISAGAKVLGPITIGEYSRIGAGAVVLDDVPSYSTVVGVPGRVVRRRCPEGNEIGPQCPPEFQLTSLDQIHLPDPLQEEMKKMQQRIEALEAPVAAFVGGKTNENL